MFKMFNTAWLPGCGLDQWFLTGWLRPKMCQEPVLNQPIYIILKFYTSSHMYDESFVQYIFILFLVAHCKM